MRKKLITRTIFIIVLWLVLDFLLSQIIYSGLTRNYGLDENSEVFATGHSHLMMALDKNSIEDELNLSMSKYTREGVNLNERLLMTKQFLSSPYSDELKIAIVGVDIYSFQGDGLSENSYLLFYPFIDNNEIGNYIKSQTDALDYLQHKYIRLSRYSDDLVNSAIRGWLGDDRNRKTNTFDTTQSPSTLKKWMRPIGFNKQLMNSLDSIIAAFEQRGVTTILLNTPTHSLINKYQPERYDSIISYYHELEKTHDKVHFFDMNPMYQDSTYLFSDPVHMNVEGRKRVTAMLIDYLRKLDD